MSISILQLLGGLVVLILGGEGLVRGASEIALRLKISPLIVGLTIVAFGTSAPELFISVHSATSGSPDMAMGNVIGSNICNLGLVLGITALIYPIDVHKDSLRYDWPVVMGSSFLLYFFALDQKLDYVSGIIMVSLLLCYLFFLMKKSIKEKKNAAEEFDLHLDDGKTTPTVAWIKDIVFIVLGIAALSQGSDWFVSGAKTVFEAFQIDERVIGIVVLALGTSLPELVTSVVAAFKRQTDLALGNLLGSNIFNVLSILGFTSMITEINVNEAMLSYDIWVMLGITFMVFPLALMGKKLGKVDGAVLLVLYFGYMYTLFISQ